MKPTLPSRYYLFRGDTVIHTCSGSAGGAHDQGQDGDLLLVLTAEQGAHGFLWKPSNDLSEPHWDILQSVDPRYLVLALLQS